MKKIITLSMAILLSACATTIPYTHEETCADTNMKLGGVVYSNTSGSVVSGNTSGYIKSGGRSIMCEVPKTDDEKNRITFLQKNLIEPKDEYNKTVGYKRWVTGIGYYFLIVPGVAAMLYYDYEREKETEKINNNADMYLKQNQTSPLGSLTTH